MDFYNFNIVNTFTLVDFGDFMDKETKKSLFYKKVNNALYGANPSFIENNLHVLSDGSFEMVNSKCPNCGYLHVRKQEIRETTPKIVYHGKGKIGLRRYYCPRCGTKFKTKLGNLKDENNQFLNSLNETIRESYANRGGSLDSIAQDVKLMLNN
ncbi:hypothetical protein MBFIL_10560 [Methanobrevibacter filiformis]|uniref:Uncharacterized protein n=1 Tax=Methanobrevibacter filiformis TaxID=55758 RepID=A0A166BEC3_9EURY|nr:hypothetical protein MBFIL_10560 [Methanobrevibacter filiformis]